MTALSRSWGLGGNVAVVTGAARGIGREIVRVLVERGAVVIACDLRGIARKRNVR